MTKSSKTILLVLGGAAILGAGGAAIYFATKQPEKVEGNGSTPKMPPVDTKPTSNPNIASNAPLTATQAGRLLTVAQIINSAPQNQGGGGGGGGVNPGLVHL
jgi:hypothetical protein